MAVVQGVENFGHQCLQLIVGHRVALIERLELRQVLVVYGIPVEPILSLVVPNGIILVHAVPQHLELGGKGSLGITKYQVFVLVVTHQRIALLATRPGGRHQQSRHYHEKYLVFHKLLILNS